MNICVGILVEYEGSSAETLEPTLATELGLELRFLPSAACDTEPVWTLQREPARDWATPLITTPNQAGLSSALTSSSTPSTPNHSQMCAEGSWGVTEKNQQAKWRL